MNPALAVIGVAGLVCGSILLVGTARGLLLTLRRGRQRVPAEPSEE